MFITVFLSVPRNPVELGIFPILDLKKVIRTSIQEKKETKLNIEILSQPLTLSWCNKTGPPHFPLEF